MTAGKESKNIHQLGWVMIITGIVLIIAIIAGLSMVGVINLNPDVITDSTVHLVDDGLNEPEPTLNPDVITDRTVHPESHALDGIVSILPGAGTYCINAETVNRGEPVTVGLHYIIQVPTTPDRFGSTTNAQRGAVFTTDNNNIVNETVVVPEGATDAIITVSYSYYTDDTTRVHIVVKKCGIKK